MAMKHLARIAITVMFLCFPFAEHIAAADNEAESTAMLSSAIPSALHLDSRVMKLTAFLKSKNVPLAGVSEHFISEADRLGLDWKLVASIAGTESYFGRHIPANSYNAWGWAIFTGKSDGRHFGSWEEGITVVSEGLKNKYVDRGRDTVWKMGPVYAADRNWAGKVNHFMEEIETFQPTDPDQFDILL